MEQCWNNIITASFQTPFDFDSFMRADKAFCDQRVLFLCISDIPIATASAWQVEHYDAGYVHMVGVLPDYKGRKLGRLITLAAMHRLRDEGFTQVVLQTDDFRLAAIKTYLNLDFKVDLSTHESIPSRWNAIMTELGG